MEHILYGRYIFPTNLMVFWEIVDNLCVMYISEIVCFVWGTAAVFWDVTPCILLEI